MPLTEAIAIAVACFLICSLAWIIWASSNAPLGYEDEDGFHYGNNPNG